MVALQLPSDGDVEGPSDESAKVEAIRRGGMRIDGLGEGDANDGTLGSEFDWAIPSEAGGWSKVLVGSA